jgi:hypothetical protein
MSWSSYCSLSFSLSHPNPACIHVCLCFHNNVNFSVLKATADYVMLNAYFHLHSEVNEHLEQDRIDSKRYISSLSLKLLNILSSVNTGLQWICLSLLSFSMYWPQLIQSC